MGTSATLCAQCTCTATTPHPHTHLPNALSTPLRPLFMRRAPRFRMVHENRPIGFGSPDAKPATPAWPRALTASWHRPARDRRLRELWDQVKVPQEEQEAFARQFLQDVHVGNLMRVSMEVWPASETGRRGAGVSFRSPKVFFCQGQP